MQRIVQLWQQLIVRFESVGSIAPQLGLRVLLAYEFGIAGIEKWRGDN